MSETAPNPYADWALDEVVEQYHDRLQDFFLYKGFLGSFENALKYMGIVMDVAQSNGTADENIQELRAAFREQFPKESADYMRGDVVRTNTVGEQMAATLGGEGYEVVFPDGTKRPTSFIDVGCGLGVTTAALAEYWGLQPSRAIGLDIFRPDSTPEGMRFEQMSPDHLPKNIHPESQDLAVVSMVLHHSSNPSLLAGRVVHALKPGALLVAREHDAVPSLRNFLDSVHVFYEQVFPENPIFVPNARQYRTAEEWRVLLGGVGLASSKIDYEPYEENPRNVSNNMTMVFSKLA